MGEKTGEYIYQVVQDCDGVYCYVKQGELVRCKDCRKHNKGINEAEYLADRCPFILHRGYAQGHEFDYQYCSLGERGDSDETD